MLKLPVTHPDLLAGLGRVGHLSTVLITDANYPHSTKPQPRAPVVWGNYRPGLLSGPAALELICDLVPIEAVTMMQPERSGAYAMTTEPPIWDRYREVLNERSDFRGNFTALQKPAFNELAVSPDLGLVFTTGEQALFANILLTIGVVQPA